MNTKLIYSFFSILQRYIFTPSLKQFFYRRKNFLRSLWYCPSLANKPKNVYFEKVAYLKGAKYISVGEGTCFRRSLFLTAWDHYGDDVFTPRIEIGKNCKFSAYDHITAINSIKIGDNCIIGKFVTISDNNHGDTDYESLCIEPNNRNLVSKGPVEIEKNVWIGDKATILSGVHIGEGAVIGANAVISKDVPPFSVVVGNSWIVKRNGDDKV